MTTPTEPTRTQMTEEEAAAEARRIIADAYRPVRQTPTSYRDDSLPSTRTIGSTPPVAHQPGGRAPMSQGATDASMLMLAGAGSVSMVSLSAGVLMYLSQYADPVICGVVFGAPTVLVLAIARLAKRAKQVVEAAPTQHHHHYTGPVVQDHRESHTRGVWAKTINQ